MRGKGYEESENIFRKGITPAHAGKSLFGAARVRHAGDHPRPCGEKHTSDTKSGTKLGSPPPMRGKG